MSEELEAGARVSGTFTLSSAMPQGKNLSFVGYVLEGHSKDDINKQLDQAHDLIDRQRMRAMVPELEVKVQAKFAALRNHKDHLEGLVSSRKALIDQKEAGSKMSSTRKKQLDESQAQIDNVRSTVGVLQKQIDEAQQELEEAKAKL